MTAVTTAPAPYFEGDGITLHHGDALELLASPAFEWLRTRPDVVIVTDPPYGIGWRRGSNPGRASKAHAGILNDHDTSTRDALFDLFPNAPGIAFGSFAAPPPARLTQTLVWRKPADAGVVGSVTGFRRDVEPVYLVGPWGKRPCTASALLTSTIRNIGSPSSPAGRTGHPHAKPVDLMRQLIQAAPPGIIIDPFAGSGSTLVAARDLHRTAIGFELDPGYCAVAARRVGQRVLDMGDA